MLKCNFYLQFTYLELDMNQCCSFPYRQHFPNKVFPHFWILFVQFAARFEFLLHMILSMLQFLPNLTIYNQWQLLDTNQCCNFLYSQHFPNKVFPRFWILFVQFAARFEFLLHMILSMFQFLPNLPIYNQRQLLDIFLVDIVGFFYYSLHSPYHHFLQC